MPLLLVDSTKHFLLQKTLFKHKDLLISLSYMGGDVDVVGVSRVHINDMEANGGAINDLQPLTFLHSQVNQQGAMLQLCERLREIQVILS